MRIIRGADRHGGKSLGGYVRSVDDAGVVWFVGEQRHAFRFRSREVAATFIHDYANGMTPLRAVKLVPARSSQSECVAVVVRAVGVTVSAPGHGFTSAACLLCVKRRADNAEAALKRILLESSDGEAMLIASEALGVSVDRTEP